MDEYEQAIEQTAQELYKVYWAEITPGLTQDWGLVQNNQKMAWRQVATFMANALGNYVLMYGYDPKGKEPFHGLDEFITSPDHR